MHVPGTLYQGQKDQDHGYIHTCVDLMPPVKSYSRKSNQAGWTKIRGLDPA